MRITIEIDCDTIQHFYSHLTVLQKQIKAEVKKRKLDPVYDEFPEDVDLYDDNCYGTHQVSIINSDVETI